MRHRCILAEQMASGHCVSLGFLVSQGTPCSRLVAGLPHGNWCLRQLQNPTVLFTGICRMTGTDEDW